jgi:hypothetical protein
MMAARPPARIRNRRTLLAMLRQDALTYGCACADIRIKLVPVGRDLYGVRQLHEDTCPMPNRFRHAGPNLGAN